MRELVISLGCFMKMFSVLWTTRLNDSSSSFFLFIIQFFPNWLLLLLLLLWLPPYRIIYKMIQTKQHVNYTFQLIPIKRTEWRTKLSVIGSCIFAKYTSRDRCIRITTHIISRETEWARMSVYFGFSEFVYMNWFEESPPVVYYENIFVMKQRRKRSGVCLWVLFTHSPKHYT